MAKWRVLVDLGSETVRVEAPTREAAAKVAIHKVATDFVEELQATDSGSMGLRIVDIRPALDTPKPPVPRWAGLEARSSHAGRTGNPEASGQGRTDQGIDT